MGAAEEPIPLKAGKRQIKVGPFMTVNYAEWKKKCLARMTNLSYSWK